jgi:hypothetical protein
MVEAAQIPLLSPAQVAKEAPLESSANGIRYAGHGENQITRDELARVVQAVPAAVAKALTERVYYFVPLVLSEGEQPTIATGYNVDLGDRAICHRNVALGPAPATFISTRLMQDRFALAFEFFINSGHQFVDSVGVPDTFADLAWSQARADVRGETSQDAYENRRKALNRNPDQIDEKAKTEFLEAAFADALAIYMLALTIDFDYSELREREYPLLAAPALAERLRLMAKLFPPNAGYDFEIRYRRRA